MKRFICFRHGHIPMVTLSEPLEVLVHGVDGHRVRKLSQVSTERKVRCARCGKKL